MEDMNSLRHTLMPLDEDRDPIDPDAARGALFMAVIGPGWEPGGGGGRSAVGGRR